MAGYGPSVVHPSRASASQRACQNSQQQHVADVSLFFIFLSWGPVSSSLCAAQMDKAGIGGGEGAVKKKTAAEQDAFEAYRRNKSYSFRRF